MLEVMNLSKVYGSGPQAVTAIADLSFRAEPGEFLCIVGPSGVGKTTLLKCLSGLMAPTRGRALLDGQSIDGPPKTLALVFQEYTRSLLPWMSVRRNVTLPLRSQGVEPKRREELAHEALAAVGLDESFFDRYPWELSGGMQQRVAIARALAYEPEVLLMDEPFASVDAQTRADLEDLVLRVHRDLGITTVFVTHDIDEAVYLADRIVVLAGPPARVDEIVTVELPRPRDQVTTKELPEFAHLRSHVLLRVRGERHPESTPTVAHRG